MKPITAILIGLTLSAKALPETATDWARLAQNPMADIIRLPVENRFDLDYGHKEQVKYTMDYKPSMVSQVSENWNVVNRFEMPVIYQPGTVPGENDSFGLGDTTYQSFCGPSGDRSFYWGIGPTFQIPTATDNQLGTRKWSAGAGGTGTLVMGPITAGLSANHLWSFAGNSDRPDVNQTTLEYYFYANISRGWWIGTSPVNTANWEAPQDQIWNIPLGGGIGKVVMNSRQPIHLKLEAYRNSELTAVGSEWSIFFEVEFLLTTDLLFKTDR
jgi:hypothetical protein